MKFKFKITRSMVMLLMILVLALFLSPLIRPSLENFQVMKRNQGINNDIKGTYPNSVDKPILDTYPINTNPTLKSASDIWKEYPTFSIPSFKQITNNLIHFKNPDNGTCTPPMFCNVFYKDVNNESNEIKPLPPVPEGEGARVGYFRGETK